MTLSKMLFGEIALRKGLVTEEQVKECLEIQKKLQDMGITKTVGAVMHDKKYLSMVEIKEILREMTGSKDWNAIEGYQILEKLGKGGMGSVYKALHTQLNKFVALKVLPPELASDQEYLDRFWREARAAAKLNHPNIVQALDVGESFGYHYFVMEYVDGLTVKDMIEQEGAVSEGRALHLIGQVTEALVHAWKSEMVHRDIKPSNIIVKRPGIAKLCDLGLAKSVNEDVAITQTGVIMGTPFYLSPEQARNEELDIRSDIYSLGVTLFHMVTGQVPFTGNTAATILYKHIFMEPPKAKSLNPKLSDGTSELIAAMLAKAKDDRPENPALLLERLCDVLEQVDPSLIDEDGRLAILELDEELPVEAVPDEPAEMGAATGNTLVEPIKTGDTATMDMPEDTRTQTATTSQPVAVSPARSGAIGTITGEVTAGLAPGHARVDVHSRRSRLRPVLVAASIAGLVGLSFITFRNVSAQVGEPTAEGRPDVEGLFSDAQRSFVRKALATAEERMRADRYGEAAEALGALRLDELSSPEFMSVVKAREEVARRAAALHEKLQAQYVKLSEAGGDESKAQDALQRIENLGVSAVVREFEKHQAELRALQGGSS